jgi:hypothetical protein
MPNDVINGSEVLVFFSNYSAGTTPAWSVAAHATSHSLSIKMATRDTSNKGTGAYETKGAGRLSVTGSMDGMYIASDTYNYADFMAAIIARTPLLMLFGQESSTTGQPDTTTSGGTHFYSSGLFLITSCDATFPDQANSTYTVTFELYSDFKLNDYLT